MCNFVTEKNLFATSISRGGAEQVLNKIIRRGTWNLIFIQGTWLCTSQCKFIFLSVITSIQLMLHIMIMMMVITQMLGIGLVSVSKFFCLCFCPRLWVCFYVYLCMQLCVRFSVYFCACFCIYFCVYFCVCSLCFIMCFILRSTIDQLR